YLTGINNLSFETMSLYHPGSKIAEPWGIYRFTDYGSFAISGSNTVHSWLGVAGGDGYFGSPNYLNVSCLSTSTHDAGYWLALNVGTWDANKMAGLLLGKFLTPTKMGFIIGELLGTFSNNTPGVWKAISQGFWSGTPLTFVSPLTDINLNTPSGTDGKLSAGLLGSTDSLWGESPANVTVMGRYQPSTTASHQWTTDISSYNYFNTTNTTYDQGAFQGYLGGIEIQKEMDALALGIFINPSGEAGYVKGILTGSSFPTIGMFKMEGTFSPTIVNSGLGINAGSLNDSLAWTNTTGGYSLAGSFISEGYQGSDHFPFSQKQRPTRLHIEIHTQTRPQAGRPL
ncbi:MAG: hypothetical protein L7F78_27335, partial [Syntrophales bacterium LBB04]|nr:hypothetical protein [Syntrophales bacterium LBB04]